MPEIVINIRVVVLFRIEAGVRFNQVAVLAKARERGSWTLHEGSPRHIVIAIEYVKE